ncbi:uncharacterized protein LOC124450510 isoform X2 [Xenia sp. Carnegie-2017]|uniref:uncharacterized protein LOC124450510 isoform X2 n=1 Tax=Xenia sp. Carnegie-2017 TaxID=2897299 RepID=UPI001F04506C|nr:uncharacterized protein LOC124450510 isoform X2 [Xenia sp. Carnegie-2017]
MNQQQIFINVPKHNPQQLEIVTVPVEVQLRNQLPMGNVSFVLVQSTEVDEIALRLRYGNILVRVVLPMSIVTSMLQTTKVISGQQTSQDAVASCHSNQGNEEDTEPMDID